MKDPADRYTPDLFDACRESLPRGTTKRFRRYRNPDNKRLDMFITKRAYRTKKEPRIAVSLMLRGFKRGQRL